MSAHRRPSIPYTDAPRGTCRWCGKAIVHGVGPKRGEPNRRRRWHPDCVDAYNVSDPREARRLVRKRDRGVCTTCGLDTKKLARSVKGRGRAKKLRDLGYKTRQSLWELDHVEPLIEGGGHGLTNLQTLCVPCHKRKTAAEAKERANARNDEQRAVAQAQIETLLATARDSAQPGNQTSRAMSRATTTRRAP